MGKKDNIEDIDSFDVGKVDAIASISSTVLLSGQSFKSLCRSYIKAFLLKDIITFSWFNLDLAVLKSVSSGSYSFKHSGMLSKSKPK